MPARNDRSAGVIVFRSAPPGAAADAHAGGRIYLLLDYGRYWDYPKGHCEAHEDDRAAAVRELAEETGLGDDQVRFVDEFVREMTYFFRDKRKGLVRKTVIFFLAATTATASDVVISHEHNGFAFLPYRGALERLSYPDAKAMLRAAEEHLAALDG